MVKCEDCGKEMTKANSCSDKLRCIKIDGKIYPRDTTGYDWNERCHDCGILNGHGNIHHCGCDMERCPACSGQLISCDCRKEAIGVNGDWHYVFGVKEGEVEVEEE